MTDLTDCEGAVILEGALAVQRLCARIATASGASAAPPCRNRGVADWSEFIEDIARNGHFMDGFFRCLFCVFVSVHFF